MDFLCHGHSEAPSKPSWLTRVARHVNSREPFSSLPVMMSAVPDDSEPPQLCSASLALFHFALGVAAALPSSMLFGLDKGDCTEFAALPEAACVDAEARDDPPPYTAFDPLTAPPYAHPYPRVPSFENDDLFFDDLSLPPPGELRAAYRRGYERGFYDGCRSQTAVRGWEAPVVPHAGAVGGEVIARLRCANNHYFGLEENQIFSDPNMSVVDAGHPQFTLMGGGINGACRRYILSNYNRATVEAVDEVQRRWRNIDQDSRRLLTGSRSHLVATLVLKKKAIYPVFLHQFSDGRSMVYVSGLDPSRVAYTSAEIMQHARNVASDIVLAHAMYNEGATGKCNMIPRTRMCLIGGGMARGAASQLDVARSLIIVGGGCTWLAYTQTPRSVPVQGADECLAQLKQTHLRHYVPVVHYPYDAGDFRQAINSRYHQ